MTILQKTKRLSYWLAGLTLLGFMVYFGLRYQPQIDNTAYLPTESILVKEMQKDIQRNINEALVNIMDRSDFELAVHVNLNQDEITEEQIKYEPQEISTSQLTKNFTPIPKMNTLPGLIDNPFHNESLPGFPSYFDQFEIEKDDYLTRGLFSQILSTAYQLPKDPGDNNEDLDEPTIIDTNESEFSDSIGTIVNQDILKLYKSGEFRPNEFLSKASLVTALVRINYPTSNYYAQDVVSEIPYKDIPRNHWAYNYIKIALENKLIEEDILFNPNKKVTVGDTLTLIEKTPLRADIFNYYEFPKKDDSQQFKTDNKKEISETNVYYNQEKTLFKTPSTKIKNIAIRLMVNEIILSDELTLQTVQDIVESVVEIDPLRNDSLIVKSYKFTNLPLAVRIYKWPHWIKVYAVIILFSLGYFGNKLLERYRKHKLALEKQKKLNSQKEEKLAKIHEEEEEKTFAKIKRDIIEDAHKNTENFTLKLEKWLELLQTSPQYEENPKLAYEKIAIIILFVDFERPGLSTKIIKLFRSVHIKDTIDTIETISKVGNDKTRSALVEFNENFMQAETLFGGKTTSNHIINAAFDEKEKRTIFNIDSEEPFGFVEHVKTNKLKEFLIAENEVVAAFILNKCSEEKMLDITKMLPADKLRSIAKHLIRVKNNPCEAMDNYEEELKDMLFIGESSDHAKNKLQIQKASSVFETLPKDVRLSIFSDMESNDPETLALIKAEMFMFDDIQLLEDVDMQTLIFEIKDMELLAKALNKSSSEMVARFKENFSERFESQFESAQESLTDIEDEVVDQAQYEIIRTIRDLEKNERIPNLKTLKRSES